MTPIGLPQPTAPLVDPSTGIPTQVWYGFLSALLVRVGGAAGDPGGDALAQSLLAAMTDPADPVDVSGLERGLDAALMLGLLADPADLIPVPDPSAAALLALALADPL